MVINQLILIYVMYSQNAQIELKKRLNSNILMTFQSFEKRPISKNSLFKILIFPWVTMVFRAYKLVNIICIEQKLADQWPF